MPQIYVTARTVTDGTVTPPYDVDNDVQFDGRQYIGTYTSHRVR